MIIGIYQEDERKTAKSAIYNTMANLISMLIGIIMIPVISRILHTEDVGIAVSFTTIKNLLMYIVTLATYTSISKAMLDYKDEKYQFLSSIFIFNTLVIGGVFGITQLFLDYIPIASFLVYWLFISIFVGVTKLIGLNYFLFHNQYIIVSIIIILGGPISQIVSVQLIRMLSQDLYMGRIIGLDSFNIIIALLLSMLIVYKGKLNFSWKHIQYALRLSVPLIMHLISQMVLTQSDILMITYFEGASKSGIYSMAYTVGTLLYTVLIQIMAAWSPWVYRQLDKGCIKEIYKYSKLLLIVGAILGLGLMTITPEIVSLFLGKEYKACIYIIPFIVVGMYFQFIYLFFYDIEYFHRNTKAIASSSMVAALTNIILNALLIPRYGYTVAAYTTVIGYLLLSVLHYRHMRKIDDREIYDTRLMVLMCILLNIFAVVIIKLAHLIMIRYMIFILICMVLGGISYLYAIKTSLVNNKKREEV